MPAGKGADMSELQAQHCIHENSEPGSCAVCVALANKMLLHEINQSELTC